MQNKKLTKNNVIIEIEALADGNIKLILDGKKLIQKAKDYDFEINLMEEKSVYAAVKEPSASHIVWGLLSHENWMFKKIVKNEEGIFYYAKERGYSALGFPVIRDYFKGLVGALRDEATEEQERKKIKLKLDSFIRALTHKVKKRGMTAEEKEDFQYFDRCTQVKAEHMYEAAKTRCDICKAGRRDYKKCKDRQKGCEILTTELRGKRDSDGNRMFSDAEIAEFLTFDNASRYVEAVVLSKYRSLTPTEYYDIRENSLTLAPRHKNRKAAELKLSNKLSRQLKRSYKKRQKK